MTPGTQVDFVLVFPELESDKEIACILFSENGMLQPFEISEMKPEAMDLLQARKATGAELPSRGLSWRITPRIKRLEKMIHSRLNKTLTRDKAAELENSIKEIVFEIEQELKSENPSVIKALQEQLKDIIAPYESELEKIKAQEEERKKLDQTVEQLSNLSPREFEEWFADLLEELGYEKVTLTPSSNDEGIDILAENRGLKVAVQCKNWKGKVGRPEIQAFLGAMQHAEMQRGLFVITGLFTAGAEKMASEHSIELIGHNALTDLIQKVRQK